MLQKNYRYRRKFWHGSRWQFNYWRGCDMLATRTIQITKANFLAAVIRRFIHVLVLVMPDMILCGDSILVLTVLGHSSVGPLQWKHQQNQQSKNTHHENIMPDKCRYTIGAMDS